jgi:hypothetical protein
MYLAFAHRPCGGGMSGDASQADPAIVVLDEEQQVKKAEGHEN